MVYSIERLTDTDIRPTIEVYLKMQKYGSDQHAVGKDTIDVQNLVVQVLLLASARITL